MKRQYCNNAIVVAGSGRNVGKTYFTCKLIELLKESFPIIGVKTSPHCHDNNKYPILYKTPFYTVIEDNIPSTKDSYLFKKSGALNSYFIQYSTDIKAFEAFQHVYNASAHFLYIIESAVLINYIQPFQFFYITSDDGCKKDNHFEDKNPIFIEKNSINLMLKKLSQDILTNLRLSLY